MDNLFFVASINIELAETHDHFHVDLIDDERIIRAFMPANLWEGSVLRDYLDKNSLPLPNIYEITRDIFVAFGIKVKMVVVADLVDGFFQIDTHLTLGKQAKVLSKRNSIDPIILAHVIGAPVYVSLEASRKFYYEYIRPGINPDASSDIYEKMLKTLDSKKGYKM